MKICPPANFRRPFKGSFRAALAEMDSAEMITWCVDVMRRNSDFSKQRNEELCWYNTICRREIHTLMNDLSIPKTLDLVFRTELSVIRLSLRT